MPAIPAIIMGGAALGSAVIGSRGARGAARTQAAAGERAANTVFGATNEWNPYLIEAANGVSGQVEETANNAAQAAVNAGHVAGDNVIGAANNANQYLDPYAQQGQQALGLMAGLNQEKFTFNQDDPSYQFRLQEGLKALEKSAAAKGGLLSGGALKATNNYAQNVASTEYGNAFNRFLDDRGQRASILQGQIGVGANASDRMGQNLMGAHRYAGDANMAGEQYAGNARIGASQFGGAMRFNAVNQAVNNQLDASRYAGNAYMGIGNAQAAGQVGSANAWTNALGQIGNAASFYAMSNLPQPTAQVNSVRIPDWVYGVGRMPYGGR